MNILYLGSSTSYVTQNDIGIFKSMGHKVTILDTYPVRAHSIAELDGPSDVLSLHDPRYIDIFYKGKRGTVTAFLHGLLKRGVGTLRNIIEDCQIDLVYAAWGPNQIATVKTIQKADFHVPILYSFMSYPLNVYKWKVVLENRYCHKPIEMLDGRIHATENMYKYMDQRFNLKRYGTDVVIEPFFSKRYFYRKQMPLLSERDGEPHLVFIASISRPWDDIRQEIYRITSKKIHLHMAQTNVSMKKDPYLHFFQYFPLHRLVDGSLATFMTQFDACLVQFNFRVCTSMDRFYTSLPSRFLFALNAAIPTVMSKGYLPACEEFVRKHGIGFTYRNIADLKKTLEDDTTMRRLRRRAIEKTDDFTHEKNINKLNLLVKEVLA